MKNIWKFKDIIDLEYFSNIDLFREDPQEKDLHRRERQFFLDGKREGDLPSASHSDCLALWLVHRRLTESKGERGFFPGSRLEDSLRLFQWLLIVCGLMFGSAMALSYFVYTGQTPLNVFTFFTIFILPQLGLIALFLIRTVLARLTRRPRSFLKGMLVPLFHRFARFFKKRTLSYLLEEQQKSFNLLFSRKNSRFFTWPLFVRAQLFGIAFNIGLLLITLFKITTVDLAFGWQTTLKLGAEGLNSVVQLVALPWSWLLPGELSTPSLAQIEGSRIILKEGIYHLATENLTSWWPFLLMSLLCYGLLPRLLLLLFGFFAERRNYRRYLNQRKFQAITQRMRTPLVSSQAAAEKRSGEVALPKHGNDAASTIKQKEKIQSCIVLVPDELYSNLGHAELDRLFSPHGFQTREKEHLFKSYEDDRRLLEVIGQDRDGAIVLVEAWMPPILEHLLFFEKLSQRLNSKASLAFCLLGKPCREEIITLPHREAAQLWKEKLYQYCDAAVIFEPDEPIQSMEVHG